MKLLADVGVIGFPNAGKSTLVSRVSAAKPKIADYPFTTLTPALGIVRVDGERTFVIADLPGLIPGASRGKGLGHQFLRHTERTRLLVHVLDLDPQTGRDPLDDLRVIDAELAEYSEDLAARPQVIVANKVDLLVGDGGAAAPAVRRIAQHCAAAGLALFTVSAATGQGLGDLVRGVPRAWRRRDGCGPRARSGPRPEGRRAQVVHPERDPRRALRRVRRLVVKVGTA